MAVTEGVGYKAGEREHGLKLAFIDVKRAYFYAKAKKDIFVKLPPEDAEPGMCGRLLKSMYGTRDAASNWEDCYMDFAREICLNSCIASPCAFKHTARQLWLLRCRQELRIVQLLHLILNLNQVLSTLIVVCWWTECIVQQISSIGRRQLS